MSVPAATNKRSAPRAEANTVEKTTKAPARKRPAARKPAAAPVAPERSRPWFAIVLVALLGLAAAVGVAVSALGDDPAASTRNEVVSANDLEAFAAESATPVYWAGRLEGRELELTRTADGTFVRYLPASVDAGDQDRVLTVATYPVADAYATATAQGKNEGMISRETRNGGLAVWSGAQPTSVYVAFARVPYLVEVYAPDAAEARRIALSGRIKRLR
jgi:hypothetical protein